MQQTTLHARHILLSVCARHQYSLHSVSRWDVQFACKPHTAILHSLSKRSLCYCYRFFTVHVLRGSILEWNGFSLCAMYSGHLLPAIQQFQLSSMCAWHVYACSLGCQRLSIVCCWNCTAVCRCLLLFRLSSVRGWYLCNVCRGVSVRTGTAGLFCISTQHITQALPCRHHSSCAWPDDMRYLHARNCGSDGGLHRLFALCSRFAMAEHQQTLCIVSHWAVQQSDTAVYSMPCWHLLFLQ